MTKMKQIFKTYVFLFIVSTSSYADTCPPAKGLNPFHPPAGWTLQIPPIFEDQTYYFGEAIHSLNGSFYFKQVICKYQACASPCPAFSLLSNKQYDYPRITRPKTPPWDAQSRLTSTLTCRPDDNDPKTCIFE